LCWTDVISCFDFNLLKLCVIWCDFSLRMWFSCFPCCDLMQCACMIRIVSWFVPHVWFDVNVLILWFKLVRKFFLFFWLMQSIWRCDFSTPFGVVTCSWCDVGVPPWFFFLMWRSFPKNFLMWMRLPWSSDAMWEFFSWCDAVSLRFSWSLSWFRFSEVGLKFFWCNESDLKIFWWLKLARSYFLMSAARSLFWWSRSDVWWLMYWCPKIFLMPEIFFLMWIWLYFADLDFNKFLDSWFVFADAILILCCGDD